MNASSLRAFIATEPLFETLVIKRASPRPSFTGALGKAFPNVWLDLCWAWALSPVQAARALDEWLSAVPCNKILACGADVPSPFAVVGYALQARAGITCVLAVKLARGEFDHATAHFVARRIMHENARSLFNIDNLR